MTIEGCLFVQLGRDALYRCSSATCVAKPRLHLLKTQPAGRALGGNARPSNQSAVQNVS